MSKGRIVWDVDLFKAVVFDESHYASLTSASWINFGTGHFAIEFMGKWDSTIGNQSVEKVVVSKSPGALGDSEAGWEVCLLPSTASLVLHFNDGTTPKLDKTYTGVWPANTSAHFRLEFKRSGCVNLIKDGVLVDATFDISGRTGSVDNSDSLNIGHQPGGWANDYFKGHLGLLRFDAGTGLQGTVDYGVAWRLKNYYELKYAWDRKIGHYVRAWYFPEDLVDASENETELTWSAGSPSYTTGWPTSCQSGLISPMAFGDGLEESQVELDTNLRMLDGTLKVYKGPDKEYLYLLFTLEDLADVYAFRGAFKSRGVIDLYFHEDQPPTCQCRFAFPPYVRTLKRDDDGDAGLWEVEAELEEI